jgi:hypothetical protein
MVGGPTKGLGEAHHSEDTQEDRLTWQHQRNTATESQGLGRDKAAQPLRP